MKVGFIKRTINDTAMHKIAISSNRYAIYYEPRHSSYYCSDEKSNIKIRKIINRNQEASKRFILIYHAD